MGIFKSEYLISAVVITFAIPLIGIVVEFINGAIFRFLSRVFSVKTALIVMNYLTFIGVIHHELAHAIILTITGAKVTEVKLFKPEGASLGYVRFVTRGNGISKCIQKAASSMAPVFLGLLSLFSIYELVRGSSYDLYVYAILFYLAGSIIIHMTMSMQDVKIMLTGIWFVFIVNYVICVIFGVSIKNIRNSLIFR